MPDAQPETLQAVASVIETSSPPVRQAPDACAIVIFGAFGDLTKRLVMPALYNLGRMGMLPGRLALIGVDLSNSDAQGWASHLRNMLDSFVGSTRSEFSVEAIDDTVWNRLSDCMS